MTEEQQIKKGFNAGYLIAKHRPGLAKTMEKGFTDKETPYALGFIAGAREHEKEVSKPRTRNYTPPKIRNRPSKGKNKDKDFREK